MSTAVAEKPATTEVVLPPIGDAPTPQQKEAFLDMFRSGKKAAPKEQITEPVKEVTEVVKTEPAKQEAVKEVAKAVPVKEEKPPTDAEKNFAALRQKAEAAEKAHADAQAEITKFKTEMEELRKRPAPEEFMKDFEKAKAERAEYQRLLQEVDVSRDPAFHAQFDTPIRGGMERMVDIAVEAGVPRPEAMKAVTTWNKSIMAEWLDGTLGPVEKMEFGVVMQRVVGLYEEKQDRLSRPNEWLDNQQKQREESAKQQREQYLGTLNTEIEANLKELGETPLGKEHTDLLVETRALLRRAGGLEGERVPNKELLKMVGNSLLMAKGFERQEKALSEKAAKIAELEKTLEERDKFIKDLNGSTPGIGGSLPGKKLDAKAAARSILNPVIN